MKKLLLTLAIILSVMALSAQNYTITEKETGNAVENGATYYIYGDGSAAWGFVGGDLIAEFHLTAINQVTLIAERHVHNEVTGAVNSICLGSCYSPELSVTPPYTINPGDDPIDYAMHYNPADGYSYWDLLEQEQHITYYLYEESTPDDKFVIDVYFKYTLNDVEGISNVEMFSNAYPMPASSIVNFDYSFNSDVNSAMVAVYNMMGQEVLRSDISGMSGKATINVSDLADGVYFYSLIVNGKTEKSSKLVVRK